MALAISLPVILSAALVATASPGPATLAILDTSMRAGRRTGLALALGVTTGSLAWSTAAALGLAAIMAANAWILEIVRYAGAAYLLFLAAKAARSAYRGSAPIAGERLAVTAGRAYAQGLLLHLTNPKPIIFFGSLYTLGVSAQTSALELAMVVVAVGVQSACIFLGYALLFSHGRIARGFARLRRAFDAVFAVLFACAGVKALTLRLSP